MVCLCKMVAPDASAVHASEWQAAGPDVVEPSSIDVAKANKNAKFKVFNANLQTPEFLSGENSYLVVDKAMFAATPAAVCNEFTIAVERGTKLPRETSNWPRMTEEILKTAKFLAERLQDVYNFYDECFDWRGGKKRSYWPPNGFIHWGDEGNAMFDEEADSRRGCVAFGVTTWADSSNEDANMARVLDIVGHECTHAVIHRTINLEYSKQPGALNESLADCFGTMIKHWKLKQRNPKTANWTVGSGMNYPFANGLRSMKNPQNYSQPWRMNEYNELGGGDDYGVHHNSGIPNHAFYLAAVAIGHPTWETLGRIWFAAMTDEQRVGKNATFADFATATIRHTPAELKKQVTNAWEAVGVLPAA
ncbi:hypothetical protein B0T14DRAFT_211750 [Immersiella caudata]|uniref:Metalloprotease n=1 Tax=Immersiella caudata TaxID=314043 RepID=A0AA39WQX1_9PEZI|nr:hypothetical protein B0T14DRAFT_211750 [Immersiella caudata]